MLPKAIEIAAKLRELPLKTPLNCITASPEEFLAMCREILALQISPEELRAEGIAYKLFGLVPASYDYERCVFDAYTSVVGAFYHPKRNAVITRRWAPLALDTLVHEVVHALQEQHFHVSIPYERHDISTDELLAFAAMVEGDAMLIQERAKGQIGKENLAPDENVQLIDKQCEIPIALNEQAGFPYAYGPGYLKNFITDSSYAGVNGQLMEPPRTTAQVIARYYGKHLQVERPMENPSLPSSLSKNYTLAYEDSLGQFGIFSLLKSHIDDNAARESSTGWSRDRMVLFAPVQKSDPYIAIWRVRMKNRAAAKRLYDALVSTFEHVFQIKFSRGASAFEFESEKTGLLVINLKGSEILLRRQLSLPSGR